MRTYLEGAALVTVFLLPQVEMSTGFERQVVWHPTSVQKSLKSEGQLELPLYCRMKKEHSGNGLHLVSQGCKT